MHLEAGWRVVGIITERRELKSPKNEKWRGYVCKVATLGMTAELQLSPEQFTAVTEGQHIAALGTFEEIPHAIATELWGRGHVWLRRLNQRNVKYCTKYTCKPGDVPAWLYLERPRATKIVRVSPGFWGEPEVSFDEAADADGGEDPYDVYGPQPGPRIEGIYKPIGESLEVNRHRYVARDERGKYRGGSVDFGSLLVALLERGCAIVENRDGWLVVDATWQQLARAEEAAGAAAAAAAPPPLHLREAGNPDGGLIPRWLYAWFDQRAREEVPG